MIAKKKFPGSAILVPVFLFLLFASSIQVNAQTANDASGPDWKQFVQRSFEALKAEKYDEYAAMLHPLEAAELKRTMILAFTMVKDTTVDQQIAQMLFKTSNLTAAAMLDSVTFTSRLLGGVLSLPAVKGMLTNAEMEILGAIPEGKELMHVLYRSTILMGETRVSQIEVSTLQRYNNGWTLTLDGEMEQALSGIIQRITGQ